MRGFHTAWSWKLVLNCCTERDRLWRHLSRQTKAALSPMIMFHEPYLLYFPIFIQWKFITRWLMTQLNRKNNKKYMDSSHTCNGTGFISNLLEYPSVSHFSFPPNVGNATCTTLLPDVKWSLWWETTWQVTRVEAIVPDSCQTNFDAGFWQAADYPVHHVLRLCNLKKGKQGEDTYIQ